MLKIVVSGESFFTIFQKPEGKGQELTRNLDLQLGSLPVLQTVQNILPQL